MATNLRESYELLGLPTNATEEEVRKAYKQKARECHPDKNPDDPEATEKFQALRQGYERIVSSEEPDQDAEYFSGFNNFFHFVIFREMMRRRMRQAMMARMFQGIFEDDSDVEEADDFLFGRPFFHQRSRHHETSSRSHDFRFHDQEDSRSGRSSYERRGSSAKPPKKQKGRKKNLRKPPYSDCNENSDETKQAQSFSEQEATFDSDHDVTTNYKCGREDFNGEESPKPKIFSKSKQRNKNKSQMTASEWQKGRKPKKHHKKKQTAKSTNSSKASEEKPDWDKTSRNSNRRQQEEEQQSRCSSASSSPNSKHWELGDTKYAAESKSQLSSDELGRELNSVKYDEQVKDTCTSERGNLKGEKNEAREIQRKSLEVKKPDETEG